jgi:hypothetical protein
LVGTSGSSRDESKIETPIEIGLDYLWMDIALAANGGRVSKLFRGYAYSSGNLSLRLSL